MRFQKIKFSSAGEVLLQWAVKKPGGEETELKMTSKQAPAPEFEAALRAFILPALDLLELDKEYGENLRVVGLSINEEEDGRCGLVVTMLKKLEHANAPLVLNTPHMREYMDEESDRGFMPDEMLQALKAAERAAKNFLDGKRAQADMFKPDAKEKAAGESKERELALV